jgi:hypothetical protein
VLQEALAVGLNVEDRYGRASILTDLVPYLEGEARQQALSEALAIINSMEHGYGQVEVIAALTSYLEPELRWQVLRRALRYRVTNDEPSQVRVLISIALHSAREVQEGILDKALTISLGIEGAYDRASCLISLLSHLVDEAQRQVIDDTLRNIRTIDDRMLRAYLLGRLAVYLDPGLFWISPGIPHI